MKTKLIASIIFLTILVVGCGSSDDNPIAPPAGGGAGSGSNGGTITLTGMSSGTFTADVAVLNLSGDCTITLSEVQGGEGRGFVLQRGQKTVAGNYNVSNGNNSNDFFVTMVAPQDTIIYYFYSGNVKIDEISDFKVSGTFTGKAHPDYLTTGVDSTKVLNISLTFSM